MSEGNAPGAVSESFARTEETKARTQVWEEGAGLIRDLRGLVAAVRTTYDQIVPKLVEGVAVELAKRADRTGDGTC